MFKKLLAVVIPLAVSVLALATPTAEPRAIAAGPTGFNMWVLRYFLASYVRYNMLNCRRLCYSTSLGVNGSGCPPGSVYYLINGGRTTYILLRCVLCTKRSLDSG